VSVAVEDSTGTLAGVIFDPNREELFTARRDGPALLNGVPLSPRRGDNLSQAMVATGLAYEAHVRAAQAQVLARLIPRVRDIRRFGSAALDLAWTAAGLYDAYLERAVRRWDVAAGALICRRAGLRVQELPIHEDLPWGILVAPPALAEELLELAGGPASA
jgi:myo-inositol-1(or 4)-monophosphatase